MSDLRSEQSRPVGRKRRPKTYVEYDSNNSGGRWWLSDNDWRALEAAGWRVQWATLECAWSESGGQVYDEDGSPKLIPAGSQNSRYSFKTVDDDGRWLGALAKKAYKVGAMSIREAADEWERITRKSATDAGCPCCGQPHNFTLYRNGKYVESGPSTSYSASW